MREKLRKTKKVIISAFMLSAFYLLRIFSIKKNKVVFTSFYGKGYGDSGKYICNELLKRNEDIDIVWLRKGREKKEFPNGIRQVRYGSLLSIYEIVTAKVWVDNSRKPLCFRKRKNQIYIQTWHSSMRLKKIEKDAEQYLTKKYIKCAKRDSRMIDYMTSGSEFGYNTMRTSFWYDGKILKTGVPKTDILFTDNRRDCRNKIGINSKEKVILYAPTVRENSQEGEEKRQDTIKTLTSFCKNGYKVLVRLHPSEKLSKAMPENVLDVTTYPDMQELIVATDILITDYSGCMFDAAFARKKCILYVPDLEEYKRENRDLYFDIEELPFYIAKNEVELKKAIEKNDDRKYSDRIEVFLRNIGSYENGAASKKIADLIIKVIKNG